MSKQTAMTAKAWAAEKATKNAPHGTSELMRRRAVPTAVEDVLRSPGQPLDALTAGRIGQRLGHHFGEVKVHESRRTVSALTLGKRSEPLEHEADRLAGVPFSAQHAGGGEGANSRRVADLSAVRVHTGPRAEESARRVNALAYTVGSSIVFGAGQYAPQSAAGLSLLTHELAHTVQQTRSGTGLLQRKEPEAATETTSTVQSVFPFEKNASVMLSAILPDSLFGFAANRISDWRKDVQDQKLTVTEISDDRLRAKFDSEVKPASIPGTPPAPAIKDVVLSVERIGAGRFQIKVASQSGATPSDLASLEVRATRGNQGEIVLTPVDTKPVPAKSTPTPASEAAKAVEKPLGVDGPSKVEQDNNVMDAMNKPPATQADLGKQDSDNLTKGLGKVAEAFFKTEAGKKLADDASKQVDKLPTVVTVLAPLTLLAGAAAGLAKTHQPFPITETPDIPLGKVGELEITAKLTYKGPVDKPTEVSASFTFKKGDLEVSPTVKQTWSDRSKPVGPGNPAGGTEARLTLKIPLGSSPKKEKEPSDTEKTRAETARLQADLDKFRGSLHYKPGSEQAREQEMEDKATKAAAEKPWSPAPASDMASAQLIENFDYGEGPGKQHWDLMRLSRRIEAGLKSSPNGTIQIVVFYKSIAGDTDESRLKNGELQDAAKSHADTTQKALEVWAPRLKGKVQTAVTFVDGARTWGLAGEDISALGTHEVAVIFVPAAGGQP